MPHLKEGGAVYTWLAVMHMPAFASALARAGIMCKQMLIWVKNTFVLGHQDYQWRHEGCLYGWKPGAAHYFTDSRSESTVYEDLGKDPHKMSKAELIEMVEAMSGDSVATDVLHYDKPSRNEDHPTMKPVKLFAYQMRNSSRKGETVLDPFGGSGTSVIAARADGPQVPVHGARPALLRRDHNEMGEHDGPRGGPRDGGSLIKRCESCGREFQAKRSTARFCCSTCRSHAYRGYAYVGELQPPAPNAAMSDDEVLEVIQRAHVAASDMSRASLMTAAPMCLSLKKAAKKMEDALRGEGL